MGEVIAFGMREKTPRRASGSPTGDAQILFFLGVRYMRMDEPSGAFGTHAPGAGPQGGKKRKSRVRPS